MNHETMPAQGPVDVNVRYYTKEQMKEYANAATHSCADILSINRSEAQLMAGEMTASEWRTVEAILRALQSRMRSNVELTGSPASSASPVERFVGGALS